MAASLQFAMVDGSGGLGQLSVDPTHNAARASLRPLEHGVYGHYRALSISGATNSIAAAGILASLRWAPGPGVVAVLTRLSICAEITASITTTTPVDVQAFRFIGSTGNSAGVGSTLATPAKMKPAMGTSFLNSTATGEIRVIGTTTALTAATGKTNDTSPFAGAVLNGMFQSTNSVGTVVIGQVGCASNWVDLYQHVPGEEHPLVLTNNDGIEVQTVTAGPATGGVKYFILWSWAEVASTLI